METSDRMLIKKKFGPCPKCKTSLLHNCMKVGVRVVEGGEEKPKKIWNADLYKCPGCKNLVVTDFGNKPRFKLGKIEQGEAVSLNIARDSVFPDLLPVLKILKERGETIFYLPPERKVA